MSLKTILKHRLTEQFTNAKLAGAGTLSLRNGYYFIKDVNHRDIREKGKFPIATVLWKASKEGAFIKDVTFEINLSSLGLDNALAYVNMVNKTILVHDVKLIGDNFETTYDITSERPDFTTVLDMILSSFMGSASTITEACIKEERDLCLDLSNASDSDEVYDATDSDEVYDAPTQEAQ